MRLRIDATPEELTERAPELIKALASELEYTNPDLSESLEKALPPKDAELKFLVLRQLHELTKKSYRKQLDWMALDIEKILNGDLSVVQKSEALHKQDKEADPDADPDYDPETGELILDPKTNLSPSETKEVKERGELDEEEEESEKSLAGVVYRRGKGNLRPVKRHPRLTKSRSSENTKVEDPSFYDPTETITRRSERLYKLVMGEVMDVDPTLTEEAFTEQSGRFYGWSVNELRNWLKEQQNK